MISPDLLAILACPVCRAPLALKPDGASLKCSGCRRVYPVADDIPRLRPEDGQIEDS